MPGQRAWQSTVGRTRGWKVERGRGLNSLAVPLLNEGKEKRVSRPPVDEEDWGKEI